MNLDLTMKSKKVKIETNKILEEFCNKILGIENIIKNEQVRYMFFVSLISSDTLINEESCNKSLEYLSFIKNNINLFNLDDKLKKETLKYVNKGIRITKHDYKAFREKWENTRQEGCANY